ncbi:MULTISPECIES: hypothetical protein [Bacillus subtilis group]|uniref:hypothetical protein n=1 Tax=Bacillus subtilis group TaxID=653685 RepID=UPI00119CC822|nr:hypothetical protein [Bacillus licheniformis]MDE1403265.1 hypothetical protein [Bacillus licheniformis]TWL74965.1 hypothetical protein CHCC15315_1904 [Bacillus licheniformis]
MAETVKLARYRNTSYFVGDTGDGTHKQYTWAGSKNGKADIKEVPKEVVEWLTMNSVCFDKGELVIVDEDDSTKELKESIVDAEAYTNNTHTKEEISKMIKTGNIAQMKNKLEKITVDSEKQFVIDVASEFSDDIPAGKLKALAEWMGVEDPSLLFD